MKVALSHQHGGSEVLKHTDFPMPKPKSGEALIRLYTAALNHMDGMVRNGWQDQATPAKTYRLKGAAVAQERLWKKENFGKITLDIH